MRQRPADQNGDQNIDGRLPCGVANEALSRNQQRRERHGPMERGSRNRLPCFRHPPRNDAADRAKRSDLTVRGRRATGAGARLNSRYRTSVSVWPHSPMGACISNGETKFNEDADDQ